MLPQSSVIKSWKYCSFTVLFEVQRRKILQKTMKNVFYSCGNFDYLLEDSNSSCDPLRYIQHITVNKVVKSSFTPTTSYNVMHCCISTVRYLGSIFPQTKYLYVLKVHFADIKIIVRCWMQDLYLWANVFLHRWWSHSFIHIVVSI